MNVSALRIGLMKPFRFKILNRMLKGNSVNVLDIGCGNHSYRLARKFLNINNYYGLDKVIYDDESTYSEIPNFYKADLDSDLAVLEEVPSNLDLIILSHVIEHTYKFEQYIEILLSKLKSGGIIYIETPHPRTLKYPSAVGFMNFHDDETHVRCFSIKDIANVLIPHGIKIKKAGTRRDLFRIFFITPFMIIYNLMYHLPFKRKLFVSGLWDFFGVAIFLIGRKI